MLPNAIEYFVIEECERHERQNTGDEEATPVDVEPEHVSSQTQYSDEDSSPDVVRVIPELRELIGNFVGGEDLGDLPAVLIIHLLVAVP